MAALPFALMMAWLMSCLLGYDFSQILPFALGGSLIFGTVFGLNNARYLQIERRTLQFDDVPGFLRRLNLVASELGYYPAQGAERFHVYQPCFLSGWAAGALVVQEMDREVILVGPRVYLLKALELLDQRSS